MKAYRIKHMVYTASLLKGYQALAGTSVLNLAMGIALLIELCMDKQIPTQEMFESQISGYDTEASRIFVFARELFIV